ncbi:MAG: ATP-dependent Clp protease ATP-binding subunit [Nitrospirae bacterium]|nr:MAG: ATP-dependent Clp protease ATP-binding subunit [Nitrospirota bacterium]
MDRNIVPKWAREIVRFMSIKPQFMLWGNVYDVYPMELGGSVITFKMIDYLRRMLTENGYGMVVAYEPLYGFTLLEGDPDAFKSITGESPGKDKTFACTVGKAVEMIERLVENEREYCSVVLNFSSRIPDIAGNDINEFYFRMFRLAQTAVPRMTGNDSAPKFNLAVWIMDKENDVPAWYTLDNPKIKNLAVPKPDYPVRKTIVENLSKNIDKFNELDEAKRQEGISIFVDQTNGLHGTEIVSIVALAKREGVPFGEIAEAIRMYKLGIVENPWSKIDMGKIGDAGPLLSKRVMGQDLAINKASDIIKRSVFNLSGSQYSKFSQRPKGVLFFAGPTGVGKTELAKAVTELLFGSETSYIRFDMSEFAHEHADQRLVGAPPGYVGYDVGGQLTNSIKQDPFSVVLFDEIEKAHPKILDVFLQILDDGRLTSGRGETAYFSESLIVFTSNLGIYEVTPDGRKIQKVGPDMSYEDINKSILGSIEDFFKYKIGRPEILNRIGDNIVVFDFIRPAVAYRILDKMLRNVIYKIEDTHKVGIDISEGALAKLREACCSDLGMGGRGVGNKLEDVFINPLSRALFEDRSKGRDRLTITDVLKKDTIWELVL